jgi:hypothetical protein
MTPMVLVLGLDIALADDQQFIADLSQTFFSGTKTQLKLRHSCEPLNDLTEHAEKLLNSATNYKTRTTQHFIIDGSNGKKPADQEDIWTNNFGIRACLSPRLRKTFQTGVIILLKELVPNQSLKFWISFDFVIFKKAHVCHPLFRWRNKVTNYKFVHKRKIWYILDCTNDLIHEWNSFTHPYLPVTQPASNNVTLVTEQHPTTTKNQIYRCLTGGLSHDLFHIPDLTKIILCYLFPCCDLCTKFIL